MHCGFGKSHLKCERRVPHHPPHPAQGLVYEPQDGKKGDQIGCDVSHEAYGSGRSTTSGLEDVPFLPEEFKRLVVLRE